MNAVHTTALGRALAAPRFEIVPMRHALEHARQLPPGSTVTVTCSPTHGIDKTVALAEQISAAGYTAVPHLAARRFRSRDHLAAVVDRLDRAGIEDVFVVGGDKPPTGVHQFGPFSDGEQLLAALATAKPGCHSIGIPCYPEGHAFVDDAVLDQALRDKSGYADYMVTQICFNPDAIAQWLQHVRGLGVTLPVYIGIPGVIKRRKLITTALRIGLGDSTRFLRKGSSMIGQFASASTYTPDTLIDGLAGVLGEPDMNVAGFHINSFNQVEKTEEWRKQRLAALADLAPAEPAEVVGYNTL